MAVAESMRKICEDDDVDTFWLSKHLCDLTRSPALLKDLEQACHRKMSQSSSIGNLYT